MARILVVDDSNLSRELTRTLLEENGHIVIGEACNGAEAFDKFMELRPDITTLDITMPVLNGIEALRRIIEADPDAKVIMVSSSAQNNKILESLMIGAADFLAKPFESQRLLECISNIVECS